MSEIVERLHKYAECYAQLDGLTDDVQMAVDAAAEIERLRAELEHRPENFGELGEHRGRSVVLHSLQFNDLCHAAQKSKDRAARIRELEGALRGVMSDAELECSESCGECFVCCARAVLKGERE